MKKLLLTVLCFCLMALPASAQNASNLNAGGFVEAGDGWIFLADADGIYRTGKGETAKIYDGKASMLQFVEGRLYFLAETWAVNEYEEKEKTAETPMSCLPDGSDLTAIAGPRACGSFNDFAGFEGGISRIDRFCGYGCFTVTADGIYFLGSSDLKQTYSCTANWLDEDGNIFPETVAGRCENAIVLYRMDLNGDDLTALTGPLGNSVACMAMDGDRIYVAAGWQDTIYAYNFVNYMIFDKSGQLISLYANNAESELPFSSDMGAFYHITEAILPDENGMLVSLSDSEGDFMASQFCRLSPEGEIEVLALEHNFVCSLVDGTTLYYIGSVSDTIAYDDSADIVASLGIYRKDLYEEGLGMKLVALPFSEYMYAFEMNAVDNYLYFRGSDGEIWRIATSGGAKTAFTENGF